MPSNGLRCLCIGVDPASVFTAIVVCVTARLGMHRLRRGLLLNRPVTMSTVTVRVLVNMPSVITRTVRVSRCRTMILLRMTRMLEMTWM
jgi:hypothetical protein